MNRAENYVTLQRNAVEDFVSGGGGVREAARQQSGVVRSGRTDVHAEGGMAAAGRAAAGSKGGAAEGFAVWTPRDTTGCMSGLWREGGRI